METLSFSAINISPNLSVKHHKTQLQNSLTSSKFSILQHNKSCVTSLSSSCFCISLPRARASATSSTTTTLSSTKTENCHWMVLMERPPRGVNTKPEIIDYYVKTLKRVLGNEKDAQMCIYDASCDTHFGFCCNVDEETSRELARLPGVLTVRPDPDYNSVKKDYSCLDIQMSNPWNSQIGTTLLFPLGTTKHWLVRMDKPGVGVVTKAQMVDRYAQILTKVLGNEKDAQMCIYHVSWQSNFGFCCELDDECAQELTGVPGVLSVQPDENFGSENKDYGGNNLQNSMVPSDSSEASPTQIKTKKLFVTGLSFYTSEKTLRAAFEGFGELVEVKIIMDKISKRSKGYAFIEYTTEEAASAALKEMNGKIINGWMIVVDVAKTTPKYSRGRPR
ncbi:Organelle RRM domain-containing protein 1 [Citrus sinensis]|uniref:Organelle RRM domain-containing protein 1 n=3 Tax=Citrus sinensis TaxID=2711 RepID=A0ACB8L687_CITSI|nr:Organelle RRM domain-containing protein 1 [Citrus sinensis]